MRTGMSQIPNSKYWPTIHITGKFILTQIIYRADYTVIMKHLWTKLNSKPKEWRRIFKALHAMEYLIKNGAPRTVQDIKDDLFKIRAL
jgi:hypothetical protein